MYRLRIYHGIGGGPHPHACLQTDPRSKWDIGTKKTCIGQNLVVTESKGELSRGP